MVRKILWLAGGMLLLFALNLGRITFIFFAGKEWGESIAINVFHPFVGLLLFVVGVIIMLVLIRPLGMQIQFGAVAPKASLDGPTPAFADQGSAVVPAAGPPSGKPKKKLPLAVPKVSLAIAAVALSALVIGTSNVGLRTFNLVAGVAGQAKLTAYIQGPVAPSGWSAQYETSYGWAKPLFGDDSVWNRYQLRSTGSGSLATNVPVVADVINTPNLSSFSAFGVENCYAFHGYVLKDITQVALAGGITGQAMSYTSQQFGSWSIVYWIVPVRMAAGGTSYERVVLYVQNSGRGVLVKGLTSGNAGQNIGGTLTAADETDRPLINNRTFLVAFAKELINAQSKRAAIVEAGSSGIST
jgi:hypothetical protein